MKKTVFLKIAICLLIVLSGCDDFLEDTKVVNVETAETGFVTEANADQAMVAIYADLKQRNSLNGRGAHVLFDAASSDVKVIRESNAVNNYTFNTSNDDEAFNEFWTKMFSVIGRCNSAIELVPATRAPEAKISRYDSEAKVLRAISYYHLMMTYNTVPLVLKTINPGDKQGMLKGDASREEIYSTMIADLEAAIANANLPWEKDIPDSDKGRVGQATARTILTYYYLSRGWEKNAPADFQKAKTYAKEVIDMGGFELEPVLLDAYYKKYSRESIFELGASNSAPGLGSQVAPWFVPLTTAPDANQRYYRGWFKLAATQHLYDAFEDGDARRYLLANGNHGVNNLWAPKFLGGDQYEGDVLVVDDADDNDFGLPTYQCAKGAGAPADWKNRINDYGSQTNWVVYRLSDVYLLYAEACIKTNDFDGARSYINKVRERARNAWTAYLPAGDPAIPVHVEGIPADIPVSVTGDDLLEAMKQERRVELHAEMKRMIDIRRWSLGGANDLESEVNVSGSWSAKYKWYPKPQDQIDLSEGNIVQNTGY